MLRRSGAQHWLRLHSLPGSKRYADDERERRVLLDRHDQVAKEVLGEIDACWLVQACWETPAGKHEITRDRDMFWACRDFDLNFSFQFTEESNEPDEVLTWNIYAGRTSWETERFKKLLLAIADDEVSPTLWMSESGAVLAPYDGGIDIFLPDPSNVERLAIMHADWCSPHPHGL
jgi:hypothetical protein